MRKIVICLLSLMLILGMSGCGAEKGGGDEGKSDQKTEESKKKEEKKKSGKREIEPEEIMFKEDVEAVVGKEVTDTKTRMDDPNTKVLVYHFENRDMVYIQMFLQQQASYDKNDPGETVKENFERRKESGNPDVEMEQIGEGTFYYDGVHVLYKDYWFQLRIGVGQSDDLNERARVGVEIGKRVIDNIDKL